MTWIDYVWGFIDNALYLLHLSAVLLVGLAAIACPVYLQRIHAELVTIRDQPAGCNCRRCDDDGPGPILPRVLPRLRRIGEEGGE